MSDILFFFKQLCNIIFNSFKNKLTHTTNNGIHLERKAYFIQQP